MKFNIRIYGNNLTFSCLIKNNLTYLFAIIIFEVEGKGAGMGVLSNGPLLYFSNKSHIDWLFFIF